MDEKVVSTAEEEQITAQVEEVVENPQIPNDKKQSSGHLSKNFLKDGSSTPLRVWRRDCSLRLLPARFLRLWGSTYSRKTMQSEDCWSWLAD